MRDLAPILADALAAARLIALLADLASRRRRNLRTPRREPTTGEVPDKED